MSYTIQPDAKRRKIRKGTHSCWACKRRKMKCVFERQNDPICQGCRGKGSQCVSQEFPENDRALAEDHCASGDRTPTIPSQIDNRSDCGILTPDSLNTTPSLRVGCTTESGTVDSNIHLDAPDGSTAKDRNKHLSFLLYEALPSLQDTTCILKASLHSSVLALASLMVPYNVIENDGDDIIKTTLTVPGPTQHPVLLARHMLRLAACLHHLHPTLHREASALSEPPRAMMQRLADTATNLVTTNDELLGSIEGLQCIMIESIYQANKGSLRRSWVTCRRAMTIAQLMGLNQPTNQGRYKLLDQETKYVPQHMWLRIVSHERHLCLMLGLPQGSVDRGMAAEDLLANDSSLGRLERMHCILASRILERNENSPSTDNAALTQSIDKELQNVTKGLPSKWWLTPNLKSDPVNRLALFWDTRRLFAHVFHYSLLIQLHLPYVLQSSSTPEDVCHYSRITCVNASREAILRFTALRSFVDIACDCRAIDFLALMAAMTLLIAHLEGQRLETGNLLAHQYLSDRALIEQVQEHMERLHQLNGDPLSVQSADLLRRLLALDGGDGLSDNEQHLNMPSLSRQDDHLEISTQTPYSIIIRIAREGIIKTAPQLQATQISNTFMPASSHASEAPTTINSIYDASDTLAFDFAMQQDNFPTPTSRVEDWAFQGVDMAFFDSLLRSTD